MTSTVYRDPHGTSTVKFGTAVYRGYREYRPSLVDGRNCACAVKIAKIDEKQRRTAKLSTSYRKSMSLNPFPVTDLRPEVELMHLLRMRRRYCHV